MFKIDKVSSVVIDPRKTNDDMKKLLQIMSKHYKNPIDLLPVKKYHRVNFTFSNTYSGFVNGLRRYLIDELKVHCLDCKLEDIKTDDDFIVSDQIRKNINLLPLKQQDYKDSSLTFSLEKTNLTNKIINIYSGDLSGNKHINELIPENNIQIGYLRPGKKITIDNLQIISGYNKYDAAKFSLLNNVSYKPIGYEPYDNFTKKGIRSSDINPTKFELGFTTGCNVTPKYVIELLCNGLIEKININKNKILKYLKSNDEFYTDIDFAVSTKNDVVTYKFINEYITLVYMVAQRCYLLDKNIEFCSPSVDRYDNEIGIIKIIHPDSANLIIKAMDDCIKDLLILKKIKV